MAEPIQYAIPMPIIEGFPRSNVFEECPVGAGQNPTEFEWLLGIYKRLKPKSVVEIGSFYGGTLWFWIKYAEPHTKIMSIDNGPYKKIELWLEWVKKRGDVGLRLISDSSADEATIRQVKQEMAPIDFLFIDGDHTQLGFQRDFEHYSSMVRGVIAFHDIRENPSRPLIGASEVWSTVKKEFRTEELIVQYGMGVAYV